MILWLQTFMSVIFNILNPGQSLFSLSCVVVSLLDSLIFYRSNLICLKTKATGWTKKDTVAT